METRNAETKGAISLTKGKESLSILDKVVNQKVVQANQLIISVAKMDKNSLKFFEIAVGSIDTDNVPKNRTVHIKKSLLFECLGLNNTKAKYSRLKSASTSLMQNSVFHLSGDVEKGEKENRTISPINEIAWNKGEDYVSVIFNETVMPFLVDLKKNFTQYQLSEITNLNGKYSIPLFKLLCMYFNQYENYKKALNDEKAENYKAPFFEVNDLRNFLNVPKKSYAGFGEFKRRILEPTLKDINEHTSLNISFNPTYKGRKVTHISFEITRQSMAENSYYKAEQKDAGYYASEAYKKQENQYFLEIAQQSPHTFALIQSELIEQATMFRDTELLINLAKHVYPFYDTLAKCGASYDSPMVKKHLDYVHDKMKGMSKEKRNIALYLRKAVVKYLKDFDITEDSVRMYKMPVSHSA